MNQVILIGNLGAAPELIKSNDKTYTRLRLATNERWTDDDGNRQERTDWHQVVAFGKQAETLAEWLSKGDKVALRGRLRTNAYDKDGETRTSVSIVADHVEFLTLKKGRDEEAEAE